MILEHIAIYTSDLDALKGFYEKYFAAKACDKYHNPRTGLQTYFLTFAGGARLELMMRPDVVERAEGPLSTGLTHLAFRIGSKEGVDSLTETLTGDGYRLKSAPRTTGDGYYESCIYDPDGNEVEIIA